MGFKSWALSVFWLCAVITFPTSHAEAGVSPRRPASCTANCIVTEQVGSTLTMTWLGRTGKPVKLLAVQLPEDAVEQVPAQDPQVPSAQQSGDSASTTNTTYVTKTEIIVVTVTIFKDRYGNIIDVKVTETRTKTGDQVQ